MPLTPGPQVPVLDSFRGVAAVGILLYHCWLLSGEPSLGGGPLRDVLSSGFLARAPRLLEPGAVTLFFVAACGRRRRSRRVAWSVAPTRL